MWEYYLEYCAAAFAERHVSDVQLIFAKDRNERFSPRIDSPTDFARLTVD